MSTDFQKLTAQQESLNWDLSADDIVQQAKDYVAYDVEFNDRIAAIENPTVGNVLMPGIKHENETDCKYGHLKLFKEVSADKKIRDASDEAEQILEQNAIKQSSRADVFRVYNKLWEKIGEFPNVHPEHRKWLKNVVRDFKRVGLDLPQDKQDRVKQLQSELSSLKSQFMRNLGEENSHVAFTKEELDGVPESVLEQLATTNDGKYKVTFKYTEISPLLKYARNEKTRQTAFMANENKLPQNAELLAKIIPVRYEIAKTLGYKSYSEYVMELLMAKTPETVFEFLDDLHKKLHPLAQKELDRMLKLKNDELAARGLPPSDQLFPWDRDFYSNLLLEREFQVDNEKISEYFPLEPTIAKILEMYEQLLDVKFFKVKNPDRATVWHEDVLKYAVFSNIKQGSPKNEFMGWMLFDLHPREGKFSHAVQVVIGSTYTKENGSREPSHCALLCNFTKPTKNKPALLKHSEVAVFFHELGHGMHNLLTRTQTARFSGFSVPKDFGECPSQMLEFWAWSKNELRTLSGHYQTGEPIPDTLIDQVIKSKRLNIGLGKAHALFISYFDMKLHTVSTKEEIENLDITKLWNTLRKDLGLIYDGGESLRYANIVHFTGGYESAYYGYLYSESLANDIFHTLFEKDPMNVKNGLRYRDILLANGAAKDLDEILEELLGRKPNSEAFLKEIFG